MNKDNFQNGRDRACNELASKHPRLVNDIKIGFLKPLYEGSGKCIVKRQGDFMVCSADQMETLGTFMTMSDAKQALQSGNYSMSIR